MSRIMVAVLLFFATCAIMAQGILAYQLNAVQSLIAEEETHDDKPAEKKSKSVHKDTYFSASAMHSHLVADLLKNASFSNDLRYNKGFAQKPYMPPEVI